MTYTDCPRCNGAGEIRNLDLELVNCHVCSGSGKVSDSRSSEGANAIELNWTVYGQNTIFKNKVIEDKEDIEELIEKIEKDEEEFGSSNVRLTEWNLTKN